MHSQIKIVKTKLRSRYVIGTLVDINNKTLKLSNDRRHIKMNRNIKAVKNVPLTALSRRIIKGYIYQYEEK